MRKVNRKLPGVLTAGMFVTTFKIPKSDVPEEDGSADNKEASSSSSSSSSTSSSGDDGAVPELVHRPLSELLDYIKEGKAPFWLELDKVCFVFLLLG